MTLTATEAGPVRVGLDRTWWQKHGRTTVVWTSRLALLVVVLVLWQVAADRWIDGTFTSKPTEIVKRLGEWSGDGTLWTNTWSTVQEIVYGFLLGAAAGAIAGFVLASLNLI